MTPHSSVPLGPYALDLDILKSGLGKPLHCVKSVQHGFLNVNDCAGNGVEGIGKAMPFSCYMKLLHLDANLDAGLDVHVQLG